MGTLIFFLLFLGFVAVFAVVVLTISIYGKEWFDG